MSDTSIKSRKSSDHDDLYGMPRGGCWTRIGANLCVFVLTLSTLLLLIAFIIVFKKLQKLEKVEKLKTKKGGKTSGTAVNNMVDTFAGFIADEIDSFEDNDSEE